MVLMTVLLIIIVLILAIVIADVNRFVIKEYEIVSDKVERDHDFLFVSDLHCKEYGKNNRRLFKAIDSLDVEAALLSGDIMTARAGQDYAAATSFMKELSKRMKCYYSLGNHEYRAGEHPDKYGNLYKDYMDSIASDNVVILDNEKADLGDVVIHGLSIEEFYYVRMQKAFMGVWNLQNHLGTPDAGKFNILLAHDPEYFDSYSQWKPDLVLSGHFHGGIARIPGIGGVISPRFKLFPKYSGGMFTENDSRMIVSCGLGSHTIPVRFLNPGELIVIHIKKN